MIIRSLLAVTCLFVAATANTGAGATTIGFNLQSRAGGGTGPDNVFIPLVEDNVFEIISASPTKLSALKSTSASAPAEERTFANAAVDLTTGSLRTSVRTIGEANSATSFAQAQAQIFALVDNPFGAGLATATVSLSYSGVWATTPSVFGGTGNGWQAILSLGLDGQRDGVAFNGSLEPFSRNVNGNLSLTKSLVAGLNILNISASMLTQLTIGTNGFINFEDTAFLSIVTSPGTSLTYDVDGILSIDPSTVAPVPLPAALPLFAGGLGLMGLLGWRRKRNAAA